MNKIKQVMVNLEFSEALMALIKLMDVLDALNLMNPPMKIWATNFSLGRQYVTRVKGIYEFKPNEYPYGE